MSPFILQVSNIVKSVEDASGVLTILQDASLSLQASESLAIVGASGSGKSTLLSIVAGLDIPTSGQVLVTDNKGAAQDFFALDEDGRAALRGARMGFVFQSFQLLAHMTALENVMLPLELRGDSSTAAKAAATAMLERVGLRGRLHHSPKVLSGGEQQRVALARAFVVTPALLLADEPTGSLDHANGRVIMDLMFELNRERKTALLLVTHDAQIAARCDRQMTMTAGCLS
jgi:putative ABC transport system ATP-binding protein